MTKLLGIASISAEVLTMLTLFTALLITMTIAFTINTSVRAYAKLSGKGNAAAWPSGMAFNGDPADRTQIIETTYHVVTPKSDKQ